MESCTSIKECWCDIQLGSLHVTIPRDLVECTHRLVCSEKIFREASSHKQAVASLTTTHFRKALLTSKHCRFTFDPKTNARTTTTSRTHSFFFLFSFPSIPRTLLCPNSTSKAPEINMKLITVATTFLFAGLVHGAALSEKALGTPA